MSWPTWSAASAPIPTALAAPVQSALLPTAINSAPAVVPPGLQYSQEQWAQVQQQNWQQWAQWQQQYQQWHQQYGAEYQKSMSALQGMSGAQQPPLPSMPNTGVPPPLPTETKPPLPPEDPPANQPTSAMPSYSTMPPKPVHAGYSTAPPPVAGQQMALPSQPTDPYNSQRQVWPPSQQPNLNNKRPFNQPPEFEQNKRPLLERPKQWGNQKPNVNQWPSQPPPNMSYNQPPPQTQQASKPNIEELSEAEKKFDKEFAAWEAQFNKWKDQNANHPDKTQYMEYEKKWESWRNSLLERREQMRRKRLAMSGAAIGVNKPGGFPQTSTAPQPVADSNRPPMDPTRLPPVDLNRAPVDQNRPSMDLNRLPLLGDGPAKLSAESPVRQGGTPDVTNNPLIVPNNPPPHQNNEPLSFKSSQILSEESAEDFLKPSFSSGGGIPGLDLVKEDEGNDSQKEEVIELDKENKKSESIPRGPDFDAISKGINTILGDQKLLSMLSIVSQNPPSAPAPNTATNSVSSIAAGHPQHNFSAPPPPHQFNEAPPVGNFGAPPPTYQYNEGPHPSQHGNDQSNHSYEERPNYGENYKQREAVNNFDDQTRSSFTMGPNDHDAGYGMNNFSRNLFNKPPGRFGAPPENDRGNLRQNFGPNTVRGSDTSFGANMPDNRSKFGPVRGDTGSGNFSKDPLLFNQGDNFNRNDFGRGNNFQNDGFNRSSHNNNRQDNYQKDNFNKEDNLRYGDDFESGNNFRRNNFGGANSFDDRKGNFSSNNLNRSGNFNEPNRFGDAFDKENFNRDQGDYDEYENLNEDDDFDKYHEMFNDDEPNNDMSHYNQGQGQGKQLGPQYNQGQGKQLGPHYNQGQGKQLGPHYNQGQGKQLGPHYNQGQGKQLGPQYNQGQGQGKQLGPQYNQGQGKQLGPHYNQGQGQGPQPGPHYNQGQGPQPGPHFNQGQGQGPQPGPHYNQGLGQGQGQQLGQRPPPPRLMDLQTQIPPPEPVPEEEPIFEPTTVIDYDHKSLKPSEPDVVVEPIHMFDFRHKPLNRIPVPQRPKWLSEAVKFIREFDPLASRVPLTFERPPVDRYPLNPRGRDEWRPDISEDRYAPRNRAYDERDRRFTNEFENHGRMDRRSFGRDDGFEREPIESDDTYSRRERRSTNRDDGNFERDLKVDGRYKFDDDRYNPKKKLNEDISNNDSKQTDNKNFEDFSDEEMNFEDTELKKHQQNRDVRGRSRSPILSNPPNPANFTEIAMIEDIINAPGRFNRPPRIVIILRGPPGSGKTYLAKLIKDKEVENGGSAPRILSLDDYFMVEHEKDVIEDGKKVRVKEMVYEYEAEMEESYKLSLLKSFKKTITDGYFPFIIVDNVNDKVKYFGEMWSFAKQNGFQVYICQLDLDPTLCTKRNIHNRSEAEIEECIAGWEPTPNHHPTIDASGFLQSIPDVEMEEVEPITPEPKAEEAPEDEVRSKWDTFDCSINNLAKLDGVNKPLRTSRTMEDYLQMEDEWKPPQSTKSGQKRVRWADLEEQREQKKMRALGFIVGHTNWDRMMDPTEGGSALTRTKYI